jgi:hypothetical protein
MSEKKGSILDIISKPVETKRVKVEHKGHVFTLEGRPDANAFGEALFVSEDDKNTYSAHWSRVCGTDFDPENVFKVKLITRYLQHEEDPARRYDETDIAQLSVHDGPLFLKLFKEALTVSGFDETADPKSAVVGAGLPNSEKAER